jgi:hypothetical protein
VLLRTAIKALASKYQQQFLQLRIDLRILESTKSRLAKRQQLLVSLPIDQKIIASYAFVADVEKMNQHNLAIHLSTQSTFYSSLILATSPATIFVPACNRPSTSNLCLGSV